MNPYRPIPDPLGDPKEKGPAGSGLKSRGPHKVSFQAYDALIEICSDPVPGILGCVWRCSILHYPLRLWIPFSSTKTSFELIKDIIIAISKNT